MALSNAIQRLYENGVLSAPERSQMAEQLSDVFNYVSMTSKKPSLVNVLHTNSARDAKLREQLEQDRQQLNEHKQFVERSFDKADQYLKSIQLGGYAAFFSVWAFAKAEIDPFWAALAAVLMIISATVFIIWELWKASLLVFALERHARVCSGSIESFIKTRLEKFTKGESPELLLARSRATVWIVCITSAGTALAVMVLQLLKFVGAGLWL